jgi:hypothetical protein
VAKVLFHADKRKMLKVRFPVTSFILMEHEIPTEIYKKTHQNFTIGCLVRRDTQKDGRKLRIVFHNFGTPLQMRCTCTVDLRIFLPSYRQCSRYHIAVCQVNMDTRAVHWKTQILSKGENPNYKYQAKYNYAESYYDIARLLFLQRH